MERLGSSKGSGEGLKGRADDFVIGVLLGQAPAGSLNVGPKDAGSRIGRVEFADDLMPKVTGCPEHGDFHEEIHADAEEEGQARGEVVDLQASIDGGPDVFLTVRQCTRLPGEPNWPPLP